MADPNCIRCGAAFTARGGARYCTSACRQAAYRDRSAPARREREAGEKIHQARARVEAGDSAARRCLRACMPDDTIDLEKVLDYDGQLAALVATSEALELESLDLIDRIRRVVETSTGGTLSVQNYPPTSR
jgi:hypothetical protein